MTILRDFALIHSVDQWSRSAHWQSALDIEQGIVHLAWHTDEASSSDDAELPAFAGLAFDPWCRLYRSLPEQGQVERIYWDESGNASDPHPLFHSVEKTEGEFKLEQTLTPLQQPGALAIDDEGHLFIIEAGTKQLLIYHLPEQRLLQRLPLSDTALDISCDGQTAYVLLPDSVVEITPRGRAEYQPLPESITQADRIEVSDSGELYVLEAAGTEDARIVPLQREDDWFTVPYAGDLLLADETTMVVARRAGEDFLRFYIKPGLQSSLPYLKALHYDGRGIVLTPEGDVAYWTERGFRRATRARLRYLNEGRIVGFQLDSDSYQNQWGRLFIDACIPRETSIKVACIVMDEVSEHSGPELTRSPPANAHLLTVNRPDLSPPMPPAELLDEVEFYPLHRRDRASELPWLESDDEAFITYEAPVIEQPGRFLWLVFELNGSSRFTPKIRSARVEHHAHELMQRLPKLYSKDAVAADFMRRYLAIMEGSQRDLDLQASRRHLLLDPDASATELLPWLAGFVGLVVDRRWPESVRRQVIDEAIWLFRFRGTIKSLKRFLDIYLEMTDDPDGGVIIIEHFRVRGLGGAFVGESDAEAANSVLGAGFRIGGRIGEEEEISINDTSLLDAFTTHAHRFSVVLPVVLDEERLAVVETILQQHRPAHTIYEICSVESGMRLGSGLHIGLTSLVGKNSDFDQVQIGNSNLGGNGLLGQARQGISVGNDPLGQNTQVG